MSQSDIPLRRWLSKQPHPALVVAEFADGSEKRVRIGVSRSKFRDAEEALTGCVSAEALDAEGSILRAWHTSGEQAKTEKTSVDPQVFRDIELAKLLAMVSDQAVARYEAIMRVAFEQNAKLLSLVGGRLNAIERAWHDTLIAQAEQVRAEAEAAAEQADPNLGLVTQALMAGLGGAAQAPNNGKG